MKSAVNFKRELSYYSKALQRLRDVAAISEKSEFECDSLIKRFEFTIELAWKTLQELLISRAYDFPKGPRPTVKLAFSEDIIASGNLLIEMLESRNLTSHAYDESFARETSDKIVSTYLPVLEEMEAVLKSVPESGDDFDD